MERHINSILNLPGYGMEEAKPDLLKKALDQDRRQRAMVFYALYGISLILILLSIVVLSGAIVVSPQINLLAIDMIKGFLTIGLGYMLGTKS